MAWTDERVQKLKELWDKGLSASQIAEKLGEVTRNAVIGKAHRLALRPRPSPLRNEPKKKARGVPPKPVVPERVTLLALTERMCKWPIGHPNDLDFHFCGKPAPSSQPYCPEHAAMAYQVSPPRRDRKGRPQGR